MKRFFSKLFTILVAFGILTSVNAVDDSIKFHNSKMSGVSMIYNAGTTYKEVTTSEGVKIGYCFNKKKDAPPDGSNLIKTDNSILPNEEKTNQYIYILDNGYGGSWNTSVIGSDNYSNHQKYYITQVALWMAQGELDPNTIKASGALGNAAYNLYSAAIKNSAVIAYEPKVSLNGNNSMTLKNGNYVSGDITVKIEGSKEAKIELINAPAGSNIIINGEVKGNSTTVSNGATLQVSVPADKVANAMTISLKANTTAIRKKIQIYKYQANDNYQNIGLIFKDTYTANADLKLNIAPKGELIVEKVDENGTRLDNAILVLKDSKGNVISKWNTKDENPKTFKDLTIGETYTIYEETAPSEYKKAAEQKITINSAVARNVKVVNTKNIPIVFSKRDITNEEELAGATLVVKDSFGNVIDTWVSTKEPHYITKELTPGEYTLTETMAPEGYAISTSTVKFTVKLDGTVDGTVVMYNAPKKGVTISKQDATTSKELPGATLVLKDSEGKVIDKWVSTTEPHYINNLPEGVYTLIETNSPEGYGISDEVITFEVKYDGKEMAPVVMYNSKIPETADVNIKFVITGLVLTFALGIFSFTKLNKRA